MFLISENLLSSLANAKIHHSYRSDHSSISISIKLNNFTLGKGFWKFNATLLADLDYLNMINNVIENTKVEYAIPVYNLDNIKNIPNSELQFSINDQLFLETLLMNIRGKTIAYSSHLKKREIKKKKHYRMKLKN